MSAGRPSSAPRAGRFGAGRSGQARRAGTRRCHDVPGCAGVVRSASPCCVEEHRFRFTGFRCACTHCQSVYSPAAYLTDVLHWLGGRDAVEGGRALDVLVDAGRRPDLGTIELSCSNTRTLLPQLDLVNELLELAVAPPEAAPAYQTRGTAEDLRVQPEHAHAPAYRVLAGASADQDAVYPFGLPYNLWLDEARTELGRRVWQASSSC